MSDLYLARKLVENYDSPTWDPDEDAADGITCGAIWVKEARDLLDRISKSPARPVAMLGGIHGVILTRHIETMIPSARSVYHTPLYEHPPIQQGVNSWRDVKLDPPWEGVQILVLDCRTGERAISKYAYEQFTYNFPATHWMPMAPAMVMGPSWRQK